MTEGFAKIIISKFGKHKWFGTLSFIFVTVLTFSNLIFIVIRGFDNMDIGWCFSNGANMVALAVCNMLMLSWMLGKRTENFTTRVFVWLITINAFMLFLDTSAWIVQGIPYLSTLNRLINSLYYANNDLLIYLFWNYASGVLKADNKIVKILNSWVNFMLIPVIIIDLLNFIVPIYFSVDPSGVYERGENWIYSQIFFVFIFAVYLISLFLGKTSLKNKLVIASFVAIPLVSLIATRYSFGVSTQYASMLISIVLLYCVLFAENEKDIVQTNKELNTASEIQQSALLKEFDLREEFEIYASMTPAMEVGGDFYDFFMIDDHRLAMIIADVSGKGISASLFMMSSKIMIDNGAYVSSSPANILEFVNDRLCKNNVMEMFVTVWLGILDINTGEITAANAGHENPVIRHKDGKFEMIHDKHGFVLGIMEGAKFTDYTLKLDKGDVIYLYTDGVTETENNRQELFKTDGMLVSLNSSDDTEPEHICKHMMSDIESFRGTAEQSDDITMLCLRYDGVKNTMDRFVIDADVNETASLIDRINTFMHSNSIPESIKGPVDIVVEEIFVNIASYAYEYPGIAEITLINEGDCFTMVFSDGGVPYDPLKKEDPDITLSAEERPIGGLGIFMVKKMMDEVSYKYEDEHNVLTVKKYFK